MATTTTTLTAQERVILFCAATGVSHAARGGSVLKGRKVPPKYRGPKGATWAGRGARPVWLVAAIKGGKKIDDFLIAAGKGRKRRRSKR